jgi:NitT/TauT family transport system permease protein
VRVAVVLALVGAVVGEFIGASTGLGALVIASQGTMDTALMFAVLVLISALGLLAYQATLLLERWLLLPLNRTT